MSGGFRRFRVTEKARESEVITSFLLVPVDGGPLWQAEPGQYLTLRVPSGQGVLLKTYSISGDVSRPDGHRITVKRETRPADVPDAPEGIGSCWLHDVVEVGTEIEIAPPRGAFVLDRQSPRPVLLLAGGVGVTPLLSMLHALQRTPRKVWMIQACENGAVHAMGDEIRALAAGAKGEVHPLVVYRNPSKGERCDSVGVIDRALLQRLLPLDDYDVYMCGPTPFMAAMFRLLRELGVSKDRIAYEFFGKATSLEALAQAPRPDSPDSRAGSRATPSIAGLAFLTDPDARAVPETDSLALAEKPRLTTAAGDDVRFARSGASAAWTEDAHSLLELAEAAGLDPAFSCRSGICGTCRCRLLEGEVAYFEDPLDTPPAGEVLICCARPRGRVVLDL